MGLFSIWTWISTSPFTAKILPDEFISCTSLGHNLMKTFIPFLSFMNNHANLSCLLISSLHFFTWGLHRTRIWAQPGPHSCGQTRTSFSVLTRGWRQACCINSSTSISLLQQPRAPIPKAFLLYQLCAITRSGLTVWVVKISLIKFLWHFICNVKLTLYI